MRGNNKYFVSRYKMMKGSDGEQYPKWMTQKDKIYEIENGTDENWV
jgi:hypothetical protein